MNFLKNNAYHVLGVDISASEKEILKRSKEITNRLKIDDYPEYDLDVKAYQNFRTLDSVKDALQRLQAPKKRIKEYFFWFQIADSVDEEALKHIKQQDYPSALSIWKDAAKGDGAKASLYKRNLAVLYSVMLSIGSDKQHLQDSLNLWKVIIDSEKFWSAFSKMYKLHDEQTASDDIIADFKKQVVSYLSDFYTELHEMHHDPEYVHEFQQVFSAKGDAKGERIEKSILNPVYQTIHNAVEKLEKMKVSADGVFDTNESDAIKEAVRIIQSELNKLIDLGLYNDSQTKTMRDRAANALRDIVLDLHNNLSEIEKSLKLLEVAVSIVGTDSLKNKLESELEQIKKNMTDDAENSLSIEVPGTFGGGVVLFKNNYLEYGDKRIFYKDAVSVSYHAVNRSINLIPVSQSCSFSVASEKETISFSFGTTLYIGNKKMKNAWGQLIALSGHLIEPLIVKNLVDKIFIKDETVTIGGVEFTKEGYSKYKSKWFGPSEKVTVSWSETIYTPTFSSGNVVLYKDDGGKGKLFTSVEMSTKNAVVIPELVKACVNRP